ncbi:MAG: nucleotide exchange factor GrpE [Methanosphaera sp.]|uniref:nucleotide exchange factor GrpE n=1 Tax=Methanosphaera sp. TaxID=2666342 RepID=UPI0025EC5B60|nr:nucleotide exchange factor GrpE [Methanosphaera sp.]MCI5866787.1 nucleotide exchange factor GrpE [Methanosphaera sp.]MDD6534301.1 nucleotide exchange factor GrpE [Methanosphaera sp.]MDY3956314.1 nucleotide exchange factor GrpE [Methanosphaera sp.]
MTEEEKIKAETMQDEENIEESSQEENTEQQEEQQEEEKTKEEQLEEQLQLYKDKIQRLQADFENFKKRSEKDRQEFVKYANEGVILAMLEVYEDLERALQVEDDKDLREGVDLIYKKFTKVLEDQGVCEIKTEHEKFDPYKHEALLTENNDDYENNEIIQDLQKGYTLNSKVIRYSKVKVCKK